MAGLLLCLACFSGAAADDEEEGGKSSDILEVMAWCKDVNDILDWSQVLRLAKTECQQDADDDEALRIQCSPGGLAAVVEGTRMILEESSARTFACANGLIFLLATSLAYARQALSEDEANRAHILLWQALQENFMLDASIWPVKTFDVLQLFDRTPGLLRSGSSREAVEQLSATKDVTIVVPRCPAALAQTIQTRFPGIKVIAGLRDPKKQPKGWMIVADTWDKPTGVMLNNMLQDVTTPYVFVVIGGALPEGLQDLQRLQSVLKQRRVMAAAGPVVSADKVYMDFCYQLKPWRYELRFDSIYRHSTIFDEKSAASVRGSWFREDALDMKEGPCKLCDTLPPTFMARTSTLKAVGFQPGLDGEWALLDMAMRAARTPMVEVDRRKDGSPDFLDPYGAPSYSGQPGRRLAPVSFALCPDVVSTESAELMVPHLLGRSDKPRTGVSPADAWFSEDPSKFGPFGGKGSQLKPSTQASLFMEANNLKNFIGPDGVKRHFGCTLDQTNCPVPNWVYRGWAVPPCCKETMRHLLFYIDDVFRDMGVRYIVTDGALLGSYKYGTMLDWDADVDLHIHSDDFDRLESEVQHRVRADGHYLRKHVNNVSWLLQANDHNYLLIELNKRQEHWDPDRVWKLPINGRLFPAMENAHLNISTWYGVSYLRHRLRHVPEWEEEHRPMFCSTPYHYNCVDESQVPSGKDCRHMGIC